MGFGDRLKKEKKEELVKEIIPSPEPPPMLIQNAKPVAVEAHEMEKEQEKQKTRVKSMEKKKIVEEKAPFQPFGLETRITIS